MKPSERITELTKEIKAGAEKLSGEEVGFTGCRVEAIIVYLKEEKERVNEALHEIVINMYDGTAGSKKAVDSLHQMIDEKLIIEVDKTKS